MTSLNEISYGPHTWLLPMTSQPAVELSPPFSVASNAKAHLKIDGDEPVLSFNVSVALFAVDFVPAHMRPVMEINIIRRKENPNPGDRSSRLKVFELLLNFRVLRYDVLMAKETFLDRWNSGVL